MDTETLRRFNRAWSQRVGVLEESFLGLGRSLGASRLLFEIGPQGTGVLDLRRRLGLDSGYLSRLLRGLEEEGLVTVRPDPADQRRRRVTPTARGRRALDRLEARSEERAGDLIGRLGPSQRRRLDDALATAERLIRAATIIVEPADARDPDAVAAVRRYFEEIGARFGFDPGDAVTSDAAELSPPHGLFLLARDGDAVAGCGGLRAHTEEIAEIKRMWVDPQWRGCGVGGRLLDALETHAARLGYRQVHLDTNGSLVEAVAMYQRAGYTPIERYNDNPYAEHWFTKRLG